MTTLRNEPTSSPNTPQITAVATVTVQASTASRARLRPNRGNQHRPSCGREVRRPALRSTWTKCTTSGLRPDVGPAMGRVEGVGVAGAAAGALVADRGPLVVDDRVAPAVVRARREHDVVVAPAGADRDRDLVMV